MPWPLHGPSRVWWLLAGLASVAAVLTWTGVRELPDPPLEGGLPWPVLLLAFVLAERAIVDFRVGKQVHACSLTEVPLIVGLFVVDPLVLVALRVVGPLVAHLLDGRAVPVKAAFNAATWWLQASVVVLLWHTAVAGHDPLGPVGWVTTVGATALGELFAALSVATAIVLTGGRSSRTAFLTSQLFTAVNVCFGLVATAVIAVDWRLSWTLVVMAGALFLAHRAHVVLRDRQHAISRLSGLTHSMTGERPVEEIAHSVLLEVCDLLSAGRAEVVLGDALVLSCQDGGPLVSSPSVERSLALGAQDGPLAGPVLAPRTTRDATLRAWLDRAGATDALVVPLQIDDRVVGALAVADRQQNTGTFTTADAHLLAAIGNHAAVAIENARLTSRLRGQVVEQHAQARHDALTGLPNRVRLHEHLSTALAGPSGCAVLLLDLDGFKDINDTLGHAAGDELLVGVAERLRAVERSGAFLSRLGGDEFVVVAPTGELASALAVAEQIHAVLRPAFPLGGLTIGVRVSVGIALAPRDGDERSTLLRRADIAMYAAKQRGTPSEVYSAGIDEHSTDKLALVTELRAALAARALTVHYQPKIDLADDRVVGVEALVRWTHPERGAVPPDLFIPLAERWGLIGEITAFVVEAALLQCASWRRQGLDVGVAVNLSPRMLHGADLVDQLAAVLSRSEVPPGALTLELTEGSVMLDVDKTCAVLEQLRALGVRLSIDDLGTGYSSLAYLKSLPVDEIKVDKSFVRGMADAPDDVAIAQALVQVGHQLGFTVVAEGVEDERTYELLRAMGCDTAQGYWMARPLPAAQVAPFAREWQQQRLADRV